MVPDLFADPPADPLPLVAEWLEAAAALALKNPHAMAVATADAVGRPSVRMVLLKQFAAIEGYAVFFTNYGSRKAREIAVNDRAAAVLYWERLGRQVRFEGRLRRSPEQESDAYFATRPRASRINAWASRQSAVLEAFSELESRIDSQTARFADADAIPRPEFWGGYRLWLEAVELWIEGADRYHERVRYERDLADTPDGAFSAGPWRRQLLQP